MSRVSDYLKSVYDSKGMSYAKIEEKTKINKSALQRYVTGTTEKIPFNRLAEIARVFDIPYEHLLKLQMEDAHEEAMKQEPLQEKIRQAETQSDKLSAMSEKELDEELVKALTDLSPSEVVSVLAFVAGLKAGRKA